MSNTNITTPMAYGIRDACRTTGLGRSTIYKLMSAGKLQSIKIGDRRLITHDAVVKLIEEGSAK